MPSDKIKNFWNIIIIILLFYTALFMPFKISFLEDEKESVTYYMDLIVDVLFGFDIIVTFLSAYEESDGSI